MDLSQEQKLIDYLSGLRQQTNIDAVPIGALIIREADREHVVAALGEQSLGIISTDGVVPSIVLGALFEQVAAGLVVAIDIRAELDLAIRQQLQNLSSNILSVRLPGQEEESVLNPVPGTAKVVLLINTDDEQALALGDLITSACRLM